MRQHKTRAEILEMCQQLAKLADVLQTAVEDQSDDLENAQEEMECLADELNTFRREMTP